MKPEISVIMPTWNRHTLLQRAIDSVLNQTFKNLELIVIDDHSDTPPNIKLPEGEDRVIPIRLPYNIGHKSRSRIRNVGIMCARGGYVAYLDSDNVYFPDHLEVLHEAIIRENADVVYGDRVYKSDNPNETKFMGKMSYDFDLKRLEHGNYIDTSDIMHTIQVINEVGFWDIFWENYADWLLMLRLGKAGKKIIHVPKTITEYHWGTSNIGQQNQVERGHEVHSKPG